MPIALKHLPRLCCPTFLPPRNHINRRRALIPYCRCAEKFRLPPSSPGHVNALFAFPGPAPRAIEGIRPRNDADGPGVPSPRGPPGKNGTPSAGEASPRATQPPYGTNDRSGRQTVRRGLSMCDQVSGVQMAPGGERGRSPYAERPFALFVGCASSHDIFSSDVEEALHTGFLPRSAQSHRTWSHTAASRVIRSRRRVVPPRPVLCGRPSAGR